MELASASPDSLVRSAEQALDGALTGLTPQATAEMERAVAARCLETGLTTELREGGFIPVPLMLRPRVWTAAQAETTRQACLAVQAALGRLLALWVADPGVRELLPLEPWEEVELRKRLVHARLDDPFLFSRLDAIVDTASPDWERSLCFLEANVVGVGGTRYTALGELVWHDVVAPRLPGVPKLQPRFDSRDLLLGVLVKRAKALGLRHPARFALVEDLRDPYGTNELRLLAKHFTAAGHESFHVDVRTLAWQGDRLFADGHEVDLVYRFPELRELQELDEGAVLAPLWRAFDQNLVVSTLAGDLDHKSCFELLTSARFAHHFSAEERASFAKHVLWTRMVSSRRVEGPTGAEIDLAPFIRDHREQLVLKPNRSYGGDGVTIGPEVSQAEWERVLGEGLATPGSWVVQSFRPLPREPFPGFRDGAWHHEPLAIVSGFYASEAGITQMGRLARASVVNLSRQGSSLLPQVTLAD